LVVLAAPVLAERELLRALAPYLGPDALVTDLGSTKARIAAWALETLPTPSRFVGGHPMTGSERSGIDAADASLYEGAVWCLTPTATTDPAAVPRLVEMVSRLGALPLLLDPERHDWLVAGASHLPLVAATALVRTLGASADWDSLGLLAAGGFQDTTRIASGDPRMSRDICLTNGPAVVAWLDTFIAELTRLRERIAADDAAILDDFASALALREAWLRQRERRQNARP
jgi:prephenate dehydrogenase